MEVVGDQLNEFLCFESRATALLYVDVQTDLCPCYILQYQETYIFNLSVTNISHSPSIIFWPTSPDLACGAAYFSCSPALLHWQGYHDLRRTGEVSPAPPMRTASRGASTLMLGTSESCCSVPGVANSRENSDGTLNPYSGTGFGLLQSTSVNKYSTLVYCCLGR